MTPGVWYVWQPQATRERAIFGACQDARYCTSEKEREADTQEYIKNAKKSAAKKSGK